MQICFAHATGFCGAVWRPVVAALGEVHSTQRWDFPGHGSGPSLQHPVDWWDFGRFALTQVEPGAVGVGHSMGGAALAMAEALRPGTFAALLLIEPVIPPPPYRARQHPLADLALKRRRSFPSREEAAENFSRKPPFAAWHREALAGYLEEGLHSQGEEMVLACAPEDEAAIYRAASAHGVWDRLGEIEPPTLILASDDRSDQQPGGFARQIAARMPRAGFEVVAGASHFLPMERPDLVAKRVERLAAVAGGSEG
jgi:pimeloyl-ACP methyl ester carboxylesterase